MGRNRKPKAVHEMNGTFEKHPERKEAYVNEPKPHGPLGQPPVKWLPHPMADQAKALFAEDKSTSDVAIALGISWETAKALRSNPDAEKNEELLCIWHEITSQAPPGVLSGSDRLHVEMTCRLIQLIRSGKAKSGDYSRVEQYLGKMAMNPVDRPKVQIGAGVPTVNPDAEEKANPFEKLAAENAERARVN